MKSKKILAAAILSVAASGLSFSGNAQTTTTTTVYIAGADHSSYGSTTQKTCGLPKYWTIVNGGAPSRQYLSQNMGTADEPVTGYGCSFGVTSDGSYVYNTGFLQSDLNTYSVGEAWTGTGIPAPLTDGSNGARGEAILHLGGVTYVAGYENIDPRSKVYKMNHAAGVAKSRALFTNESVESSGTESIATLWVGNSPQYLSQHTPSAAQGILYYNNTIYISGYDTDSEDGYTYATVWTYTPATKKLSSFRLSPKAKKGAKATDSVNYVVTSGIAGYGSTIYITGYQPTTSGSTTTASTAYYWSCVSGSSPLTCTSHSLPGYTTNNAYANGVAFDGNGNMAIVGYDTSTASGNPYKAVYWKKNSSGTMTEYQFNTPAKSYAQAIVYGGSSSTTPYVSMYGININSSAQSGFFQPGYWSTLDESTAPTVLDTTVVGANDYAYGIYSITTTSAK